MGARGWRRAARSTGAITKLVVVIAGAIAVVGVLAPGAAAHKDPESGAVVTGADNAAYTAPTALDGKRFANPRFRVVLQDNSPRVYSYNGGSTSTTAYLELDLALLPSGPCPTNPSGYIDIQTRDLAPDLSPLSPWSTTNSFTKSFPCSYASRGETWHFGRDSMGFVTQSSRDFEVRLVDRSTRAVYLTAAGTGSHVTPKAPTALTATPGIDSTVSLGWQDNSQWESHMELQRAGIVGTPWTTIARVNNTGAIYGPVKYQDRVPFSPSNLYRYRVRAVAGDRASEWSPVAATSAPSTPLSFRATTVARTSVTLEWEDAYGESAYDVVRSRDGFATIERSWELPAGSTWLIDSPTESIETYQYRIRARHDAGASAWSSTEVTTPGLLEPEVAGFVDAATACPSDGMTLDSIGSCIYGQMYEYEVLVYEAKICTMQGGVVTSCQKLVFQALVASDMPHLPDDEDPSVPPPPGPDGKKWVPPSEPGEDVWQWGSNVDEFPTRQGSWSRPCANGKKEYLHWDSPHGGDKPDHWGFIDCSQKEWELPMNWVQYGRNWYPKGHTWW